MRSLRQLPFAIAGLAVAVAVHGSACAANVFMLQFGSYQSQSEAQAHLDELNAKHPGALSRLQTSVRIVTLPPDNLTVYRTQAGPLASRADAQAVCSQLESNGDECYIVESAMESITTAAAAPPSVSIPPAAAAAAAAANPASAPISVADSNSALTLQPGNQNGNVSALPPAIATAAPGPVPARDAGAPLPAAPATLAGSDVSAEQSAAAEASVRKALDDAAARQDSGATTPPAPVPKPHPSFWEQLNPFSDDSDTASASNAATASASGADMAAPVLPVTAESVAATAPPPPAPPASSLPPLPAAPAAAIVVTPPVVMESPPSAPPPPDTAPLPPPTVRYTAPVTPAAPPPTPLGQMPPAAAAAPVIATAAPNFPLPPPPAPLRSAAPPPMAANPAYSTATTPAIAPAMPVASAPLPAPANATVQVEEARRVPLSQAPTPPVAPANPVFAQMPSVDLSPSSTTGQRTLWAQIGRFGSAQAALAYWANYRQMHPDFPVVRVRVTTSMAAQQRGIQEANLRVGPFTRPEFITSLCNSLMPPGQERPEGMQCGAIADLGVAVNPYAPASGYLGHSRYDR